jgi:hypothetical protein
MHRSFEKNASPTIMVKPATLETGFVTNTGAGTNPGPWWYHMTTEEIVNAIIAGGLTPDNGAVNQLGQVITNVLAAIATTNSNLGNTMPYGGLLPWPGPVPPPGFIKANGVYLPRSGAGSFPLLTSAVLSGTFISPVLDTQWANQPARFSLGNGTTTIRIPDLRGMVLKGYHDGSGSWTTNTSRSLGSYEGDDVKRHQHGGIPRPSKQYNSANSPYDSPMEESQGSPDWYLIYDRGTLDQGGDENLVRNMSILWCIRAY